MSHLAGPAAHTRDEHPLAQALLTDMTPIPRPQAHRRRTRRALRSREHDCPARRGIRVDRQRTRPYDGHRWQHRPGPLPTERPITAGGVPREQGPAILAVPTSDNQPKPPRKQRRRKTPPDDQTVTPPATGPAVRAAANLAVVRRRAGRLVVFSAVSGGTGLTEVVLAVGEALAARCSTLMIEASPLGASLAARTGGQPSRTLAWSLGRIALGHRALPAGLTPPAESHSRLGRCDRICQTAAPGGPPLMSPEHLLGLVEEARDAYEVVVVEIGPLFSAPPGAASDRFAAGRAVLAGADMAVVFAGPDPESAVRMGEWRVTANEVGCRARCLGVFARLPRRSGFQRHHLAAEVDHSCGPSGFESFRCLPYDPRVARARWNGELVTAGPWLAEINAMATDLSGMTPLTVGRRRKQPDQPGPVWGQPSPVPRPVSLAEEAALVRSRAR